MLRSVIWACALGLAPPALGQNITAVDANAVMLAMQEEGFLVTQETSDDGTPRLASKVSDTTFRVYFYGCEEKGAICTSVQFSAGYDLNDAMSVARANLWNTENRYGRAVIDDEGDPYLRMDVAMFADGIGVQNFVETLDLWRLLVEEFEGFIDW